QGFLAGDLDVTADGNAVGSVTGLARKGIWHLAGRVHLDVGTHVFELHYPRSVLSPGTGVRYAEIDALALRPATAGPPALEKIAPSRWRSLCNRRLDWIEVVRPARAGGA